MPLSRFNGPGQVQNTGFAGSFGLAVDTLALPSPTGVSFPILAGETWHFQAWYRDGAIGTNNLTNAIAVTFL